MNLTRHEKQSFLFKFDVYKILFRIGLDFFLKCASVTNFAISATFIETLFNIKLMRFCCLKVTLIIKVKLKIPLNGKIKRNHKFSMNILSKESLQ
jgi:hypothetical protein